VQTAARGSGSFAVGDDGSISGAVSTTGIAATSAQIHEGGAGEDGPYIVSLAREGNTFKVPAGSRLTAEQLQSLKAGKLYVNVHSRTYSGGEIRGQLKWSAVQ
jgi:hypothetical protein